MLRIRRSANKQEVSINVNGRHILNPSTSTSYIDYAAAVSSPSPPAKSLLRKVRSTFLLSGKSKKPKATPQLSLRHDQYSDEDDYGIEEDIRTPTSLGPMARGVLSPASSSSEDFGSTTDEDDDFTDNINEIGPFLELPTSSRSSQSRSSSRSGSGCGFDVDLEMERAYAKTNGNTLDVVQPSHRRISLGLKPVFITDDTESKLGQTTSRNWMGDPYNKQKQPTSHKSTLSSTTLHISGLRKSLSFRSSRRKGKPVNGSSLQETPSSTRPASPVEQVLPPALKLTLPDATNSTSLLDATFGTTSPIHRHLSAHLVPSSTSTAASKQYQANPRQNVNPHTQRPASLQQAHDVYITVEKPSRNLSRSSSASSMSSFIRQRDTSTTSRPIASLSIPAQPQYRPMSLGLDFDTLESASDSDQLTNPRKYTAQVTQSTPSLLKAINGTLSRVSPKPTPMSPVAIPKPTRKKSFQRSKTEPTHVPVPSPQETKPPTPTTPKTPHTPTFRMFVTLDVPSSPPPVKRTHSIKRVPVPQPFLPIDKPQPPLPPKYTLSVIELICTYSGRRSLAKLARVSKSICRVARRLLYAKWTEEQEMDFITALPTLAEHNHLAILVRELQLTRRGLEAVLPLAVASTLSYGIRLGPHLEFRSLRSLTIRSALPTLNWISSLDALTELRLPGLKDQDVINYINNLGPGVVRETAPSISLLRIYEGPPALVSLLDARGGGVSPPQSPKSPYSEQFRMRSSSDGNNQAGLSLKEVLLGPITTSLFSSPPFRPASVIRAMGSEVVKLGITFGQNDENSQVKIDRRTIERTIDGIGALALLQELSLLLAWELEDGDDDMYKSVSTLLPTLSHLHTLRLSTFTPPPPVENTLPKKDSHSKSTSTLRKAKSWRRSVATASPASFAFPSPPAFAFPSPPATGVRLSLPATSNKPDQSKSEPKFPSRSSLPAGHAASSPNRVSTSSATSRLSIPLSRNSASSSMTYGRLRQRPPALVISRSSSNTTMPFQIENENDSGTDIERERDIISPAPTIITPERDIISTTVITPERDIISLAPTVITLERDVASPAPVSIVEKIRIAEVGVIKSPDRMYPESTQTHNHGSSDYEFSASSNWSSSANTKITSHSDQPSRPIIDGSASDTSSSDAHYIDKHRLSFKDEDLFYSPPQSDHEQTLPSQRGLRSWAMNDLIMNGVSGQGQNVPGQFTPTHAPDEAFPDPSFPGTPSFNLHGSGHSPYEPSLTTLAQPQVLVNPGLAPPLPLLDPMFFPATPNSATFRNAPNTALTRLQTRQKERTLLFSWIKLCPSLQSVVFLSGLEWTSGDEVGWVEPGSDDSLDSDIHEWMEDSSQSSDYTRNIL